jgi:GAF domain-containing protein
MDDRKFGAIYLWDKLGGRAFVDDDEVLLSSLARAISVTLAQALDHARRKRLEAELDLLAALAREVGGAGTVEQVAEVTRRHTEAYFQWDAFGLSMSRCHGKRIQSILQIDKAMDQEEPEDVAIHTPFVDVPSEGLETSTSDQVNRRVLSGEPVLINRQNLEGVIMMSPFGNTCKPSASLVYVPIPSKDRTLGVITIQSYQKNRYALADMQFMQRIALAVAPAFRRCIAEQRTRAFFALAQKLSAASTPHQAAHIIVDVAEELIGWDSCSLHFHDPETNTSTQILMVDTMNGEKVEFQVKGYTSNPGGLSRRAIKEGPILYLRPEARFDREQSEPFGDADRPSASLMYAPLKFNHTTIGVLSIQSYTVNAYDADDLELLQALADHCSGAIERIRKS